MSTSCAIRDGRFEVRFNDNYTEATVTIYPPETGGKPVSADEIVKRFRELGVTYGIRESAIREAVHNAQSGQDPITFVAAQGVLPVDGMDGIIHFRIPREILTRPLPKNRFGQVDWFAIEPERFVEAGQELACIVPPSAGTPGKTLIWPIRVIEAKPGKPAELRPGPCVRVSEDGFHFYATTEGVAELQGSRLGVRAFSRVHNTLRGGLHRFAHGAAVVGDTIGAWIVSGTFLVLRGRAINSLLRVNGDLYLHSAIGCKIVVTGDLYVDGTLNNCQVDIRGKILGGPDSQIVGGSICAQSGIQVQQLGSPTGTPTEVLVSSGRYNQVRAQEIEEELAACETNIESICRALKPFSTLRLRTLPEEKQRLVQKLQDQLQALEEHQRMLYGERRSLSISRPESVHATIQVAGTSYPGVRIEIGNAVTVLGTPAESCRFYVPFGENRIRSAPLKTEQERVLAV
jgi:uncharacterized protein (DUF342 family)